MRGNQQHRYLLSQLVPSAAQAHPDGIAAVCGTESLTWAELDRRVGQLATALIQVGVQRGDRVGIYLHKSIESLVAVHGIVRAGAAYVPIDPLAPTATVETILADCGIKVLVTHPPRTKGVEAIQASVIAVGLEPSWDEVATLEPSPPSNNLADDLAYVMYTSGSTGKPKGIMHTHRSGMAYALMAAEIYQLGPDDRVANFSPLHFDMSTFEVLAGVSAASRVVLIPEPYLRMPASLTTYLAEQGCTTLYTVPSLMQQMMYRGALGERDLSSVRWVMPAGEVFPPEPLLELMRLLPHAKFSNVYGPAEVNQCTHCHFSERYQLYLSDTSSPSDQAVPPVPIGEASRDAEVMLIDDDDRPIDGPGVGALIVRTSTMMAGYWNRPDLTAAGFMSRVGPDGLEQRWYRTGDLVERTDAGDLIFLGRKDNQVKVRGNRIELEVVEASVGNLAGVEQVVVGVRGSDGEHVLVAHYVAAPGADEPDVNEWRQAVARQVPNYAVPSAFEAVDAFPLTPSGKIDRRTARQRIAEPEAEA